MTIPSTRSAGTEAPRQPAAHPLPRWIAVTTTLTVGEPDANGSLFRPCEFGDGWRTDQADDGRYNDFDAELARELRDAGPHFSAEVYEDQLLTSAHTHQQLITMPATFQGRPITLTLRSARFGLTDVGQGVITVDFSVAPARQPAADASELVDLSIVNAVRPGVEHLVRHYLGNLRFTDGKAPATVVFLWGHILYEFNETTGIAVDELAPNAEADIAAVRLDYGAGFIRPGLGSSVLAGVDRPTARRAARVLALISAYYAAAAEFDRMIFSRLQARVAPGDTLGIYGKLFEEVSLFQAILSTLDLHLAASTAFEVRLWSRYSQIWRLDRQQVALTDKLGLLRTFEDREASRRSLNRAEQLSVVAAVFTVLGFVSTLIALIDFGQAEPLTRPDGARSVISAFLITAVLLIFAFWIRRRVTRSK